MGFPSVGDLGILQPTLAQRTHKSRKSSNGALNGVRVLVVDDERLVRRSSARLLAQAGATVVEATSASEALNALGCSDDDAGSGNLTRGESSPEDQDHPEADRSEFDVVLTDIAMPGGNGIDLLRRVRDRRLSTQVVLLTGVPDVSTAVQALHLGALDYLIKPVAPEQLQAIVGRAAALAQAHTEQSPSSRLGRFLAKDTEESRLGRVLDGAFDSLWMAFQPIVDRQGDLHGYEALLRVRQPSFPGPEAVVEAAERLGRLRELGRCTRAAILRQVHQLPRGVSLFINLHANDLGDPALFDDTAALVGMVDSLVLEITERASFDAVGDPARAIARLRQCGAKIAIDDLGAGYAGLTALTQVEPDVAKLDMGLVRGVDTDPRRARVVEAITNLCHDLGIAVVVEGVETEEERDALLDFGCDLFQGYLIGRPNRPHQHPSWPAPKRPSRTRWTTEGTRRLKSSA